MVDVRAALDEQCRTMHGSARGRDVQCARAAVLEEIVPVERVRVEDVDLTLEDDFANLGAAEVSRPTRRRPPILVFAVCPGSRDVKLLSAGSTVLPSSKTLAPTVGSP